MSSLLEPAPDMPGDIIHAWIPNEPRGLEHPLESTLLRVLSARVHIHGCIHVATGNGQRRPHALPLK